MKKKILIIRSVSFQQLDQNMTAMVKRFPEGEYQLHLLTHGHGVPQARTYSALTEIIDYESRGNFNFFHLPEVLKKRGKESNGGYDGIIVPVTNKTGAGFLNVLVLTLRIPARTIYICNLVSELREVRKQSILKQMARSWLHSFLAGVGLIPVAVLGLPFVLLYLGLRRGGGSRG